MLRKIGQAVAFSVVLSSFSSAALLVSNADGFSSSQCVFVQAHRPFNSDFALWIKCCERQFVPMRLLESRALLIRVARLESNAEQIILVVGFPVVTLLFNSGYTAWVKCCER